MDCDEERWVKFTLVEERIGQLHFFEELLSRVFVDIQLVTWNKQSKYKESKRKMCTRVGYPLPIVHRCVDGDW